MDREEEKKEENTVYGYSEKQINRLLYAELSEWMKLDKECAYRDLWAKCNEDVKAVCKTKPSFKRMEKFHDYLELYMMIHISGGGFTDPNDMREKVENEWLQFKMFPKVTLDAY